MDGGGVRRRRKWHLYPLLSEVLPVWSRVVFLCYLGLRGFGRLGLVLLELWHKCLTH